MIPFAAILSLLPTCQLADRAWYTLLETMSDPCSEFSATNADRDLPEFDCELIYPADSLTAAQVYLFLIYIIFLPKSLPDFWQKLSKFKCKLCSFNNQCLHYLVFNTSRFRL